MSGDRASDLASRWAEVRSFLDTAWCEQALPPTLRQPEREPALAHQLTARLLLTEQLHTGDEILGFQDGWLRGILRAAATSVPLYREALPEPEGLCLAGLSDLPLLSRTTILERWEEMVSLEAAGGICNRKVSSGTSGAPVTVLLSEEESYSSLHYDLARAFLAASLQTTSRWASPYVVAVTDNTRHPPFGTYNPILGKWCRFEVVDALEPSTGERILRLVEDLHPAALVSRPTALRLLADLAGGDRLGAAGPLPALSSGSNLYADDRRAIAAAFGGPVIDLYAISECSGVASQCQAGSYHVHWELAVVEVVDPATGAPAPRGAAGEIVVTDLTRRAMPIIRYRTGDWGRLATDPCPCGRAGPTLTSVEGKDAGYFPLADGRRFNPAVLSAPLSDLPGLKQFRVTQTAYDRLFIEFVGDQPLAERIAATVNASIPTPMTIDVRVVATLGPHNAKVQRYRSLVAADRAGTPAGA